MVFKVLDRLRRPKWRGRFEIKITMRRLLDNTDVKSGISGVVVYNNVYHVAGKVDRTAGLDY
jgi:hypothetical protein